MVESRHRRPSPEHEEDRELHEISYQLSEILDALHTLTSVVRDWRTAWEQEENQSQAVKAILTLTGDTNMASTISVDDASGLASLGFEDDHGDASAPPAGDGSGLVVVFASDTLDVATIGATSPGTDAAGNGIFTAPATPIAIGVFNLSVTLANESGAPLTEADGVTPFPIPAPVAITVVAGPAAAGELSLVP